MTKTAFITGITGQDGSYLAELLLEKGYIVHGLIRRSSLSNLDRIWHLCNNSSLSDRFFLHQGDLCDSTSLMSLIRRIAPDELYNLAAMSDVKISFDVPEYTADVAAMGTLRLLEIVRNASHPIRFYQASTSELYGKVQEIPQTEKTPFYPRSPYGVAKLYAFWILVNYRESYGLHASNGILFNHESPRRGGAFVSRKITQGVSRISLGLQDKLILGNLEAKRDWGYAKDFVEGMWRMLQVDKPGDYVLATGQTNTVRHFVELAFQEVGISLEWEGSGLAEKGRDRANGKIRVEISSQLFRPSEVDLLVGNASKAKRELGWVPQTTLEELVHLMVQADLSALTHSKAVHTTSLLECLVT